MSQSPPISVTCFPRVECWHRCMKNCVHHLLMKSFRHCYKRMHKGQTSEDSHGKQGICHSHIDVNDVIAASVSDNHRRFARGAVFWLCWICLQSCPVWWKLKINALLETVCFFSFVYWTKPNSTPVSICFKTMFMVSYRYFQ